MLAQAPRQGRATFTQWPVGHATFVYVLKCCSRTRVRASFTVPTPSSESYNRHPMSASDPTPLELAQPDAPRGRLKVFLGYAPGVGKSFRMFDEARSRRKERGQDVVVPRSSRKILPNSKSILSSLETVPTIDIEKIPVIDVPAILRRRPQVCVVDGLAYDNPWNHNKHRWQDVEELLANGINVLGSVNLQHIDDQREAVES